MNVGWPLLLILPFVFGFLASHPEWYPVDYHLMLLLHVLSAELCFVVVPFSQSLSDLTWRFPPLAEPGPTDEPGKESLPA